MTVSIESFLVLEKSLSNRLLNSWRRDVAGTTREILDLVQAGDFAGAVDICEGLSLAASAEENRRFAEFIGMQAILFGASRLSGDPRKSTFMDSGRPDELKLAANNLVIMMEENATQSVCRLAITMLGQEQVDQQEATVKKDATPKFPREFVSSVGKNGKGFIDIGSSLHTSRLASWGFTIEATARGIESFQITEQLDGRTCPVCRTMHGRKFDVAQARTKLENWMSTTNPDDMKSVAPWPRQDQKSVTQLSQMSKSQIQDKGWDTPPFHPLCRGVLVRSGSVTVVEPAPPKPIPEVVPEWQRGSMTFDEIEKLVGKLDITGGDGTEDRWLRTAVQARIGKGKKSQLASTEAFNKNSNPLLLRGVSETKHVAAQLGVDDYMGIGIYGNGQYYGVGRNASVAFQYGNMNFNGHVFAAKMKNNAKVINSTKLNEDHTAFFKQMKAADAPDDVFHFFGDPNRYAAWRGFDAVKIDGVEFMVVLNKAATMTHKGSLPGQFLAKRLPGASKRIDEIVDELIDIKIAQKKMFTTGVKDAQAGKVTWESLEEAEKVFDQRKLVLNRELNDLRDFDKRRAWSQLLEEEFGLEIGL